MTANFCWFLKNKKANQSGVSLVELLVFLLLLNIVLAVGYMFYGFGMRSFNVGEARANVQQNVRIASSYISNQLRYAFEVQILDETFPIPSTITDDYNYIFVNEYNSIEHKHSGGSQIFLGGEASGSIIDELEFNISDAPGGESIINYTIMSRSVGQSQVNQSYSHTSEVFISNLRLVATPIKYVDVTKGTAIRYIKNPNAPATLLALPTSTDLASEVSFTLVLSFAKIATTMSDTALAAYIQLGGAFTGLTIDVDIIETDEYTTAITIYNVNNTGIGTITIAKEAFINYDDELVTTVIVESGI